MMMTPRRPVVLTYDGERQELRPDVDHLHESHELVQDHPELFAPASNGRNAGARGLVRVSPAPVTLRPSTATMPKPNPRFGIEPWRMHPSGGGLGVIERPSPVGNRLAAWDEITDICDRTTGRDGLESGGVLLGGKSALFIDVVRAAGPGPGAIRQRDCYMPDVEHDVFEIRRAKQQGLQPCGYWHVHPNGGRSPSASDLEAFGRLKELDGEPLLMLIVVPGQQERWEAAGFAVAGSICQRVKLTLPGRNL